MRVRLGGSEADHVLDKELDRISEIFDVLRNASLPEDIVNSESNKAWESVRAVLAKHRKDSPANSVDALLEVLFSMETAASVGEWGLIRQECLSIQSAAASPFERVMGFAHVLCDVYPESPAMFKVWEDVRTSANRFMLHMEESSNKVRNDSNESDFDDDDDDVVWDETTESVQGGSDLLQILGILEPRENTELWTAIRSTVQTFQAFPVPSEDTLDAILDIIGASEPQKVNTNEWASIQRGCLKIKKEKVQRERVIRFIGLLFKTYPKETNLNEWALLRATAGYVLSQNGIKEQHSEVAESGHHDNETPTGAEELLSVLEQVTPMVTNVAEWEKVRNFVSLSNRVTEDMAIRYFIVSSVLSTIVPQEDNLEHWKSLRRMCNIITAAVDSRDCVFALTLALSEVLPRMSNADDFESVRTATEVVLGDLDRHDLMKKHFSEEQCSQPSADVDSEDDQPESKDHLVEDDVEALVSGFDDPEQHDDAGAHSLTQPPSQSVPEDVEGNVSGDELLIGARELLGTLQDKQAAFGNIEVTTMVSSALSQNEDCGVLGRIDAVIRAFTSLPESLTEDPWPSIRSQCESVATDEDGNRRILRLATVLSLFVPDEPNKSDWAAVRESAQRIISLSNRSANSKIECSTLLFALRTVEAQPESQEEWMKIREILENHLTESLDVQIDTTIDILGTTTPKSVNIDLWGEIRSACAALKEEANFDDRVRGLAAVLSKVIPEASSLVEWSAIQEAASQLLQTTPEKSPDCMSIEEGGQISPAQVSAVHEGFFCSISGVSPIVGNRWQLTGVDQFNLCEVEYQALPDKCKRRFQLITTPGEVPSLSFWEVSASPLDETQTSEEKDQESTESESRLVVEGLLPDNQPPQFIRDWTSALNESEPPDDLAASRDEATKWLLEAVCNAHMDEKLDNFARELLASQRYTTFLDVGDTRGLADILKPGIKSHLIHSVDRVLAAEYDMKGLHSVLSTEAVEQAIGGVPTQDRVEETTRSTQATVLPVVELGVDWTAFWTFPEDVYAHALLMVATAVDEEFQAHVAQAVADQTTSDHDISHTRTPPMNFQRLLAKSVIQSSENKPTTQHCLDVIQSVVTVSTPELLLSTATALAIAFGGVTETENLFSCSTEERMSHFHQLHLKLTVRFSTQCTYEDFLARPNVKVALDRYAASRPSKIPHHRWENGVARANAHLFSKEFSSLPVCLFGEIRLVLKPQADLQQKFDTAFLVYNADSPASLYNTFIKDPAIEVESPPDSLWSAATAGNLPAVKSFLQAGSNENERGGAGDTPAIHEAVRRGYTDIVKELLDSFAAVDETCSANHTALHVAAESGHADCVELLLAAFANIEARNGAMLTPLCISAIFAPVDVVLKLLSSGAAVDSAIDILPLHFAAHRGRADVAKVLIEANAEVDCKGVDGKTPLQIAVDRGYSDVARVLVAAGADAKTVVFDDATPLLNAMQLNQPEMVLALVVGGIDPNQTLLNGEHPLLYAIKENNLGAICSLIASGATLTVQDKDGDGVVQLARRHGHVNTLDVILAAMQSDYASVLTMAHVAGIDTRAVNFDAARRAMESSNSSCFKPKPARRRRSFFRSNRRRESDSRRTTERKDPDQGSKKESCTIQ